MNNGPKTQLNLYLVESNFNRKANPNLNVYEVKLASIRIRPNEPIWPGMRRTDPQQISNEPIWLSMEELIPNRFISKVISSRLCVYLVKSKITQN